MEPPSPDRGRTAVQWVWEHGAWTAVMFLTLAAGAVRVQGLGASLDHDEVFTWVEFASRPWGEVCRTYTLPNNHLLHTLCVKASAAVFGRSESALRLPALVGGLLGIGAVATLARALTGRGSATWLTVLLLSVLPAHIGYSRQARGYTLMLLWSALLVYLALQALRRQNGAGRWWAGAAAAGFLAGFTIPSAIYQVATVWLWAAAWLAAGTSRAGEYGWRPRVRRVRPFLVASVGMALAYALVYLPIYSQVLNQSKVWGIPVRDDPGALLEIALASWGFGGPARGAWLVAGVAVLGLGLLLRSDRQAGTLALSVLLLPFAINLATGQAGPARAYFFCAPVVLVAVANGGLAVGEWLSRRGWVRRPLAELAVGGGLTLAYVSPSALASPVDPGYREMGRLMSGQSKPGDLLVIPYIMDTCTAYYGEGVQRRRLEEIFARGGIDRLVCVARRTGSRFSLSDYLLTTNYQTAEANFADTQTRLHLPGESFAELASTADLFLASSIAYPRSILGQQLADPTAWMIYYERLPGATRLSRSMLVGPGDEPTLSVEVDPHHPFVLHTRTRFTVQGRGLVLLKYAKSVGEGAYASLFEADGPSPAAVARPVQMAKAVSQTVEIKGGDPYREWYGEVYLAVVVPGRYYGLYVYGTQSAEQLFSSWGLYSVPF